MNHTQLIHFATIHFPDLSPEDIEESLERAEFRTKKMLDNACENEAIDLTRVEPMALKRLEEEVADSTANLTLSYLQYKSDYVRYGKTYKSIAEYYKAENKDASLFEQCCYEGHPFHPMSKTKLGFTPDKVLKFAPEFKQPVSVMEVHVHRSLVEEKGEAIYGEASDYGVIYVHEWQWAHVIMANYHDLIDKELIKLGAEITAAPLLSFRSLLTPEAVIKTAVSVQATSAVRNVSRASIENGIELSQYVDDYYRKHHYTGCHIQKDIYGSWFQNNDPQFACLLRERIPEEEGIPVVAASFINQSFITGELIMKDFIDELGSSERFIRRYTELLMKATYQLMIETGISLEAHMQNTVILMDKGLPSAVYIRDFGGIRILAGTLPLNNDTGIETDYQEDLFNVMSHAVICNHLLQIYRHADEAGLINYQTCLDILKDVTAQINDQTQPPDGLNLLLQPELKVKALLSMRLRTEARDYQYIKVCNPVYEEVQ
ncbi:IucA/IucC family protein [Macrococcus brunensis]|uniref:IucA/IucC family protein n=1 Tax=Macrococcus brunensis TaxID=198483 RepID=UPI001EEFD21D|nr:IucA/IucC family protein [Macrococcus brunensis]ULG72243.1 hypothetical protein MGG12_01575 [Macrococcus brunensis]